MIAPERMRDGELEYVIADINAAIKAHPETENIWRYLEDRETCQSELNRNK